MAASIWCLAGRSLLGGLGNSSLGVLRMSSELTRSDLLFQQTRTFIQMGTNLKVVDNSGAKRVKCIQALKSKKGARLGDIIVASVQEINPAKEVKKGFMSSTVKKGAVVHAVVVRAAMPRGRCDGSQIKFDDNACVLVKYVGGEYEPIGKRVHGPVPHELRKKKHVKILSLAGHVA
ncbi:large ribosomal subunit protein uL14mz-like [Apium graveolens]|uniref:large ribosomal subunit protein uL14mz-like n=1 Tax=Apium graveolens TaxID=4045 RepID=UPI003D790A37